LVTIALLIWYYIPVARYNCEAFVLKKINYRDSDRIYTLLTRDKGKISATARGVRKISSRRNGNLDTINHIVVSISESNAGFRTLGEVSTVNSYKNIKGSLDKSLAAYYMAELIHRSIEDGGDTEAVFRLFELSLNKLDENSDGVGTVVNKFEFLLMKALGYEMSLDTLRSYGRADLDRKLKAYVKENLGENFKSLEI
jgi:DNA repair protein RecO (recombination protein O)